MSGPVWRFASDEIGTCVVCLREAHGLYVEGDVVDNSLVPSRRVCSGCFTGSTRLVVSGELGRHEPSPAYAREP